MPAPAELKRRIETHLPGSTAEVVDTTGTEDHFRAHVRAPQFAGLPLIEQHRLVNGAVDHLLGPGRPIHALKIKTEATQ